MYLCVAWIYCQAWRKLYESGGHPSLVYAYNILPFVLVVKQALIDNVLLRFGMKRGRTIALSAPVVPLGLVVVVPCGLV